MTTRERVERYLQRIADLDGGYGAVRCLAPDALEQADACDAREVPLGPLDGVVVLVKDNVDVAGLPTTAGALALGSSFPAGDAPLVSRLRDAGAVVLGKTNLTELANFTTRGMPSGYSSLGGQVLNAYDRSLTPSGSSSGSATAVALELCDVAIGTETDGSITSPADHQSLVGLKPTLGLVSRTGVVPIASSQDTPGPLARTVAEAAALLAVLAGPDPLDGSTADAHLGDVLLDPDALRGVRLAVARTVTDVERTDPQRHAEALTALEAAGAVLVDVEVPVDDERPEEEGDLEQTVLVHEFGRDLDTYLARLPDGAPVRTIAELQQWNRDHAAEALKFGQTWVDAAVAVDHAAERPAYLEARAADLAKATQVLEALLGDAEAVVFPGASGCSLAARAGWPSIVVPGGYAVANRRPSGLMLVSRRWTDARLLTLAFAFEQATLLRRPPWEVDPAGFRGLPV